MHFDVPCPVADQSCRGRTRHPPDRRTLRVRTARAAVGLRHGILAGQVPRRKDFLPRMRESPGAPPCTVGPGKGWKRLDYSGREKGEVGRLVGLASKQLPPPSIEEEANGLEHDQPAGAVDQKAVRREVGDQDARDKKHQRPCQEPRREHGRKH